MTVSRNSPRLFRASRGYRRSLKFLAFMGMALFLLPGTLHAVRLKIATLSPDGSYWMERMNQGAEETARLTEGRVEIKFYPGGVMGDDKAVLRKIRVGQLQGGAFVAGSLAGIYPDIQIFGLPLKFRSFEEVDHVRQRMDPIIAKGLEDGGMVPFGFAEGGFAYTLSAFPVRSVQEMAQRKVWVPDNDNTVLEAVKAFDFTPIPLSIADVRAGLQTGLIDTVTTPPIAAVALQWHTQVKYLMDMPFLYVYAVFAVDKRAFAKISPADQGVVKNTMGAAFQDIGKRNRSDHVEALAALRNQNIEFLKPSDDQLAEWRRRAEKVPELLIRSGQFTAEMVQALDRHLQDFRMRSTTQ